MCQIAQLLEIPGQVEASAITLYSTPPNLRANLSRGPREHRPLFSTANRVPGFAAALRRESMPSGSGTRAQVLGNKTTDSEANRRRSSNNTPTNHTKRESSASSRDGSKTRSSCSRECSPKVPRPRSEEIPLEDFRRSQNSSPVTISRPSSNSSSVSHTPSRFTPENSLNNSMTKESALSQNPLKDIKFTSEETSFIANEERSKKKGGIETV